MEKFRTLGSGAAAMKVSALGFGCMGLNYHRGAHPGRKACIRLIREAAERGVNFFDTAEGYGPFYGWRPVPLSLFIQNHCAKSGNWGLGERTPEACTNLSWEVRFLFGGLREGIEVLAEPIFVRAQPFNGRRTLRP